MPRKNVAAITIKAQLPVDPTNPEDVARVAQIVNSVAVTLRDVGASVSDTVEFKTVRSEAEASKENVTVMKTTGGYP